ncbi:MAG: peptidyl-prolyl cis-trans isomerase [Prevotellaceae bacterium]|nr:peptidyl-prolyl cis-trans isomerase [Prevotellaceae bacterium]
MRRLLPGLLLLTGICTGCQEPYDHKGRIPLAEVDGIFLYKEEVEAVHTAQQSPSDSIRFVNEYIHNWVEETLLFEKAQSNIPDDGEIEQMVNNYRQALIMHTYQQALIQQQLSDEISEEELTDFYEQNKKLFRLERPLIQGLFIKVPLAAPQLGDVRRWYKTFARDAVEHIEKYSLQNAVTYKYFYDKWLPLSEVLNMLPLEVQDAGTYVNENRHIELKDTAFYYFLNVSDCLLPGEIKPYPYARAEVKDMLLNIKQVEFMKQVKADLYKQAVKQNKIKYYLNTKNEKVDKQH